MERQNHLLTHSPKCQGWKGWNQELRKTVWFSQVPELSFTVSQVDSQVTEYAAPSSWHTNQAHQYGRWEMGIPSAAELIVLLCHSTQPTSVYFVTVACDSHLSGSHSGLLSVQHSAYLFVCLFNLGTCAICHLTWSFSLSLSPDIQQCYKMLLIVTRCVYYSHSKCSLCESITRFIHC